MNAGIPKAGEIWRVKNGSHIIGGRDLVGDKVIITKADPYKILHGIIYTILYVEGELRGATGSHWQLAEFLDAFEKVEDS